MLPTGYKSYPGECTVAYGCYFGIWYKEGGYSIQTIRKVFQLISSMTLEKSFNLTVPHFFIYIICTKIACIS